MKIVQSFRLLQILFAIHIKMSLHLYFKHATLQIMATGGGGAVKNVNIFGNFI